MDRANTHRGTPFEDTLGLSPHPGNGGKFLRLLSLRVRVREAPGFGPRWDG